MHATDILISVGDLVLDSIDDLNRVEYNKKGRKYRFVNNTFQRIREEDKHLVICPEDPEQKLATISSYYILSNIGNILNEFPDFCLLIIGCAQQLEQNRWYEVENSSVIHYKNTKYDPMEAKYDALEYVEDAITDKHIEMGLNLLICSKLNFLHTDHHIGTKVEGYYMKHYVTEYFGIDALNSPDVLVALKSFVHWGNITGILYRLDVPHVNISEQARINFANFPDPSDELKLSVYDRYPSGTSRYSLIRKSIDILGDWQYSKLIPYPESGPHGDANYDLGWLYELCHNIEKDPIRYHLRSATKSLCQDPENLAELGSRYSDNIKHLLVLISLLINIFPNTGGEFLLQNSKIPKFSDDLIGPNRPYYDELVQIRQDIETYENKGWDADDIVLRLAAKDRSLFSVVMAMREQYIDDYE